MKKLFLWLISCALISMNTYAQVELVKGANMEDASKWTGYWQTQPDMTSGTQEFNYTASTPSEGEGGCYRITLEGQSNGFIYQPITVTPGHRLKITAAVRSIGTDTIESTWMRVFITPDKPDGIKDIGDKKGYVMDSWMTKGDSLMAIMDGTIQDGWALNALNNGEKYITIAENDTVTTYYVVVKVGCWNPAGKARKLDILFDEVSVVDMDVNTSGVDLIKGGNMEDASKWTGYWQTQPDMTSGTQEFNYTASTPSQGEGGCYRITLEGQSNGFIYQAVTVTPGHSYDLRAAVRSIGTDSIESTWMRVFLTPDMPDGIKDIGDKKGYVIDSWMTKGDTLMSIMDGTIQDDWALNALNEGKRFITIPEDATSTTWYVVVKVGCWNPAGKARKLDILFDEITLIDQSIISKGGDMETSEGWNVYWQTSDVSMTPGTYEFGYTANTPAAGEGGAYRITSSGKSQGFLWQPILVTPGHNYKIDGAYKHIGDSIKDCWIQVFLTPVKPDGIADITTLQGYDLNTWMTGGQALMEIDGTFQDDFVPTDKMGIDEIISVSDTIKDPEWYLVLKVGMWQGESSIVDVVFDNLYVTDLGLEVAPFPIEKIVYGTVDDEADYTGSVRLTYDMNAIYMNFEVVDDSIVTSGNPWQVDNIEITIDMDNSKNIHWPRNGGWIANDPTFDTNDYQLRLVPGVDFATNNSVPAVQVYTKTDNGYKFSLTLAWEDLLAGFVPAVGTQIGFDVLLSDNDAVASDANRNQITWNSPTTYPFNDPSIWGTLELRNNGMFMAVLDETDPSDPANVVATVTDNDIVVTWDASTDNTVVHEYIIFKGTAAIDTILAKETGNKYEVKDLDPGKYKFSIIAMDVYGNKSYKTTSEQVEIISTGINNHNSTMLFSPNPVENILNIRCPETINSITVYNVTGQAERKLSINAFDAQVSFEGLKSGIYFVKVNSANNVIVEKIVKR